MHECELLIESLGLTNNVKMLGSQNVAEIMPKLGVMMLTSISEAQPLVLLEAMAAGIPCIATEVGACREIIDGAAGEDAELGSAGVIIPIASPIDGAQAILQVLNDTEAWLKAGDIGKSRVNRYYDEKRMYDSYRSYMRRPSVAGIGFELRKILKKNSLLSMLEAYGLAGLISSGPWVISILALLAIGMISIGIVFPTYVIVQFLVIVTYLMAGSLIISGLFQLLLTRFISDLLFGGEEHRIVPNLLGSMLVTSL